MLWSISDNFFELGKLMWSHIFEKFSNLKKYFLTDSACIKAFNLSLVIYRALIIVAKVFLLTKASSHISSFFYKVILHFHSSSAKLFSIFRAPLQSYSPFQLTKQCVYGVDFQANVCVVFG